MRPLTKVQRRALESRGNLLVVAGAGTGKTHTLVERCVSLIEGGCAWSEILMVTFTEAAAAEMRGRIRGRLIAAQEASPSSRHIEEQLALLDVAHISTLHSFCLRLIRDHFHHDHLRLDPQFAVLSEEQLHQLRHQTLDLVLEKYYGGDIPEAVAFRRWVTRVLRGGDAQLREMIWRLHSYSRSLPDPDDWFERQAGQLRETEPRQWRLWYAAAIAAWRDQWLPVLKRQPPENKPADLCIRALERLGPSNGRPAPARFGEVLEEIVAADDDAHWPRKRKTVLRAPLVDFFKETQFLLSLAPGRGGEDPLAQDWEWTRHDLLGFIGVVREFGCEFARAKREAAGVDFADLEQFALRLLWDARNNAPTAIASAWRSKLKHVFVDEYQDINAAQDMILRALSAGGFATGLSPGGPAIPRNRFLVGDVKQSIYRFRLADPSIFRRYKREWDGDSGAGQSLPLSENFRSREGLLDFFNSFFSSVMRESVGGVAYDGDAALKFGAAEERAAIGRGSNPGPHVELHLLLKNGGDESAESKDEQPGRNQSELADLETTEKEARMVALRLRELRKSKFQVWDDDRKQFRDVQWGDMVVLLRAPAGKVESFAKQFHRAGVPLHAARGGFYDTTEISDLLALLQLLDNPLQDIPTLAVLRSPLVGLSLDELVAIRAAGSKDAFWVALQKFARTRKLDVAALADAAENARRKVRPFLDSFESWRRQMREGALAVCLEEILAETQYESLLLAQDRGEERVANVRQLLKLARRFDPFRRQGLFRFLNFVETQREAESENEPAPTPTRDAVRLLSIHQSKGLEFPVVVAADLGKAFNQSDLSADFLLDSEYGLCPRVTPPGRHGHYPSLPYWLARRSQWRDLLGEELRLLYVALTRAKDRLILSSKASHPSAVELWRHGAAEAVSIEQILSTKNYWTWLRLWLAGATREADWQSPTAGQNALVQWTVYAENDPRLLVAEPDGGPSSQDFPSGKSAILADDLVERVIWGYPFAPAAGEFAKTSVTAQRRRAVEQDADEEATAWSPAGFRRSARIPPQPRPGALSPAEIGTAHHKFLQRLSLKAAVSAEALRAEARRLCEERILTREEMASLDFDGLAGFWSSSLGIRMREREDGVRRELPFTARFTPGELETLLNDSLVGTGHPQEPRAEPDDFVVLQGVADLAVLLPNEIWLVDFKTDNFGKKELGQKVKIYEPQLRLYAEALRRVYQRQVTECCLYFIPQQTSVQIRV